MDLAVTTAAGEDRLANLFHVPQAGAQDKMRLPLVRLQLSGRLFAGHPSVSHDADRTNLKTRSQSVDNRDQRLYVGDVARQ